MSFLCHRFFEKERPEIEQSCQLPCPVPCVVSQYGPWGTCSVSCGNGTKTRVSTIIK